jgi:hypothetical protein
MANEKAKIPVEAKAIRFAPGRKQKPLARFWKLWAQGDEVYATGRASQGLAKFSFHASGEIHLSLGPKNNQTMAPLMQMDRGPWMHALEVRFLLSEGASAPQKEKESLKNKSAFLIEVPEDFVFHANLVIGVAGTPVDSPLPTEFGGAQILWQTQLRDRRPAVLLGRMLPLNDDLRNQIRRIRHELKPTVTASGSTEGIYVEIFDIHWSVGGNVVQVVPMGPEAVRSEQEDLPSGNKRTFRFEGTESAVGIYAPNGNRVAELAMDAVNTQLDLVKNQPSVHKIGTVKLSLETNNLIAGNKFMAKPCMWACVPSVNGGRPRNWEYTVYATFDGAEFSIQITYMSSSLRNKNLNAPIDQLADTEELVIRIPEENLRIAATITNPVTSVDIAGRFTLRDVR